MKNKQQIIGDIGQANSHLEDLPDLKDPLYYNNNNKNHEVV